VELPFQIRIGTAMTRPIPLVQSVDDKATRRHAAIVVGLMIASQIMNQVDRSVIAVGSADIMRDLGLSAEQYGVLASAFYSFHAVTGIIIGLTLAHRVRPLLLVTWMIAIWTVIQLPPLFLPTFITLLISRVVLGAAESACMPASVATTHELYPPDRRSLPTSLVWIGAMVGMLVAPPILTVVMTHYGWKSGFAVCAILSGLLLTALLLVRRRTAPAPEAPRIAKVIEDKAGPRVRYWANGMIISLTLVGFCAYWMTAFSVSWLFPMVHMLWGYSQQDTGWITAAIFSLCSVNLLLIAAASQRMLKRGISLRWAVMTPVAACMLVGSLLLGLSAFLVVGVLKLVLLAIGISLMPVVGSSLSVIISYVSSGSERNRLLLVVLALTSLAGVPAPYVTGWLINRGGQSGYDMALLCCCGVTMAGGLLALTLLRRNALRSLA
jgi:MFS family permease